MRIELTAADGHRLSAWRAGPADARRALVVVQEIFGVNRHMRRVCDDYAAQGYAVVCPALFDRAERGVELGYAPADVARGRELRGRIDPALTVLDIRTAAAALPAGARRGIVGFCWGGTVAWHGATRTGVRVAANDFDGDGTAEILAGTGAGSGASIRVFNVAGQRQALTLAAFPESFTGGVFLG